MKGYYLHDESPAPLEADDAQFDQAISLLHEMGML